MDDLFTRSSMLLKPGGSDLEKGEVEMLKGYNGKILHVDLTQGEFRVEKPGEAFYRKYMGGSALALYYLLKERVGMSTAFSGALIYSLSNYAMLLVYVRGGVGEIISYGMVPWLFLL